MPNILIVDDDATFCLMLKTFLEKKGFSVKTAFSFSEGQKNIKTDVFDAVLTDIRLPENDGLELLTEIKRKQPQLPVILMTGYGDIRSAVKAIKMGAFEYVTKPVNPDEMLFTVNAAIRDGKGQKPASSLQSDFVGGVSEEAAKLNEYISLVAPTGISVLILGESGTGKEYVARKIHQESDRASKPFIAVDCGALSKDLATSEFFGHVKGAFTSAVCDKTGQFVEANGGTLFLDEVGNLSYEVQVQLLRAIQERKIKPIGSNKEISVDVRIIAATNEDLSLAVQKGEFREDLYHRLNEFSLNIPSLSERGQDLILFARHFLEQANKELNRSVESFDEKVINVFKTYSWPGNIRELKNVIRRAVLLTRGSFVTTDVLPRELLNSVAAAPLKVANLGDDLKETIDRIEFEKIKDVLEKTRFNKSKAAQMLNIDRKTLYNKMKQFGIE